jgi:hypothetical protein
MKVGDLDILIGADPEVFVTKRGKLVCAHNMVQGTKEAPFKVDNGAVQVDGMALEFNIDPANSAEEFVNNIDSVMAQLGAMVPEYQLKAIPVAEFGAEIMAAAPEEAKEMGCDPDYNAWEEGAVNPKPNGEVDFRTGAGHIHIGWTNGMDINDPGHIEACIMLTKQLDFYLGLPSLLFDDSDKRRELYGKAGAFRVKPYGVEYRVLSNAWLKTDALKKWAYDNTILAIRKLLEGEYREDTSCRIIIDGNRKQTARTWCQHYGVPIPAIPAKKIPKPAAIDNNCKAYNKAPFKAFFGDDNVQRT